VVVLVSRGAFHNDEDGNDPYDPEVLTTYSWGEAVAALTASDTKVIAATYYAADTADMQGIADATGGELSYYGDAGSGLFVGGTSFTNPGVWERLHELTWDVTSTVSGCDALDVTLTPSSFPDVAGGASLATQETVKVPAGVRASDLPPEGILDCEVQFRWGSVEIGTQDLRVQVPFPSRTTGRISKTASRIKAYGRVLPKHPGKRVVVKLSRKANGSFRLVATKRTSLNAQSRYGVRFARPRAGKCRVTALFGGDGGHLRSSHTANFSC
jgi:hypothetical protein